MRFVFDFVLREKQFLFIISLCFLIAGVVYPYPEVAMWFGFALAGYSAVANDSIQTIGTFIASSHDKKWWLLWLFIGIIFLITVSISWIIYDGDVSFQRLASSGFSEAPKSFHFLQIAAPIFLIIITRLRMPVSTTFLLLSSFTTSYTGIVNVFYKSIFGYFIAFVAAFLIWYILERWLRKSFKGEANIYWVIFQWITSGSLWTLWIVQDAANIAVFLPRSLSFIEFAIFSLTIFFGLGIIFYLRGDNIQNIIDEKTNVKDVRPATVIDLVYAVILIFFTLVSTIPMSTTWVFIGLLGGRELAIKIRSHASTTNAWSLIRKDLLYAFIGLVISIIVAMAANETIRNETFKRLIGI